MRERLGRALLERFEHLVALAEHRSPAFLEEKDLVRHRQGGRPMPDDDQGDT